MGTIRNRVVIVHHWDLGKINSLREDAIKTFQETADSFNYRLFSVENNMVTPIMTGFANTEYTFFINGECSKLRWEESDLFQEVRKMWCKKHKNEASNILIVDFGQDTPASVKEYSYIEED